MKEAIVAKVAFNTLGCKVNQYETESMMAQFETAGYEVVAFSERADVYIVNTCTVTNMADKKSRQMLSKAKKLNEEGLVAAVGCYVQAGGHALAEIDNVDLLVGNTDKGRIVEVVEGYLSSHLRPEVRDLTKYRQYDDMWISHASGHTRVHVKVQDGCDQFCSYCIIPFARGRIRSREQSSVIEEVESFVAKGYQEVVLTGIHLASYGVQFEDYRLIDLLEDLDNVHGLERIRLGSLEPTLIDETFVERLSMISHICDHFHLSMQSGDDRTLKAMNRKYSTDDYSRAVDLLRSRFPDCAITTDLIVGFPGETEEAFNNTLKFIEKIGFSDVHVFKYSIRNGTKAGDMPNQIDGSVKNQRSQRAIALVNELKKTFAEAFLGREIDVLMEETMAVKGQNYLVGHTTNYMKVYLPVDGDNHEVSGIYTAKAVDTFEEGLLAMLK